VACATATGCVTPLRTGVFVSSFFTKDKGGDVFWAVHALCVGNLTGHIRSVRNGSSNLAGAVIYIKTRRQKCRLGGACHLHKILMVLRNRCYIYRVGLAK